jgi:hypothetical protein
MMSTKESNDNEDEDDDDAAAASTNNNRLHLRIDKLLNRTRKDVQDDVDDANRHNFILCPSRCNNIIMQRDGVTPTRSQARLSKSARRKRKNENPNAMFSAPSRLSGVYENRKRYRDVERIPSGTKMDKRNMEILPVLVPTF